MSRSRSVLVAALACLPWGAPVSQAEEPGQQPMLVHMQAALDIDVEGRVSNVEFVDERKLPEALRRDAAQVARSWRFMPPTRNGKPVSGRTFAGMHACLVPSPRGIDYTFAFTGNGPAGTYLPPRKPRALALPVAKLLGEGVDQVTGRAVYVVSPEGTVTLESAVLDDPKLQARFGPQWFRDQRELFKAHRYRPELIDGVPTATRLETQTAFRWFGDANRADIDAKLRENDEHSDACRKLRGEQDQQIASDSVFRRIDS